MLIEQLKKANIDALKNKDSCARSILSVVLNKIKLAEIERRTAEKTLEDADVVAILLKTQRNWKRNLRDIRGLEIKSALSGLKTK